MHVSNPRPSTRFAVVSMAGASLVSVGLALGADADATRQAVVEALNSLRGIKIEGLAGSDLEALGKRLDQSWKTLRDHPDLSRPLVRDALLNEREDSFLIIDLSRLWLSLNKGREEAGAEIVQPLLRADPNAYGKGYFELASWMASQRRVEWLPVVMGMLRLKTLDAFIDAHALPVDLSLGLVFTVVQYGEAALQPLKDGLASDDCTVRANAAACLGVLLSDRDLPQLRKTAQGDSCEKARSSSWVALGLMNDPRLSRMAEQRLNSQPAPGIEEKHALATALSATFSRSARDSLELLAGDGDQGLAQAAKNAMKDLEENLALASKRTPTPRAVLGDLAEVARRELRRTPSTFRFEGFEGKSAELSLGLGPADLEPVLRARTEVLRRLSDECLYEFRQLTYVARNLRLAANLPPRDLK